jgi:PleD family two-component response regulator
MSDTEGGVARKVLDTLRGEFAAIPHETDGEPLRVTFSAGVASLPRHASVRESHHQSFHHALL